MTRKTTALGLVAAGSFVAGYLVRDYHVWRTYKMASESMAASELQAVFHAGHMVVAKHHILPYTDPEKMRTDFEFYKQIKLDQS